MAFVTKMLDYVWNIRFLQGYRTKVAEACLIGLSAYQYFATSKELIDAGSSIPALLPDINTAVYSALMVYFGGKIRQFAKEHRPV